MQAALLGVLRGGRAMMPTHTPPPRPGRSRGPQCRWEPWRRRFGSFTSCCCLVGDTPQARAHSRDPCAGTAGAAQGHQGHGQATGWESGGTADGSADPFAAARLSAPKDVGVWFRYPKNSLTHNAIPFALAQGEGGRERRRSHAWGGRVQLGAEGAGLRGPTWVPGAPALSSPHQRTPHVTGVRGAAPGPSSTTGLT